MRRFNILPDVRSGVLLVGRLSFELLLLIRRNVRSEVLLVGRLSFELLLLIHHNVSTLPKTLYCSVLFCLFFFCSILVLEEIDIADLLPLLMT